MPLLSGAETEDFVRLRQRRFEEAWGMIDQRIQVSFIWIVPSRMDAVTDIVSW